MDEEQSKLFIMCSMIEMQDPGKGQGMLDQDDRLKSSFPFMVTYKRFLAAGIEPTIPLCLVIAGTVRSPAEAVMIVYTCALAKAIHKLDGQFGMNEFAEHVAPMGLPTEAEMNKAWDEQKVDSTKHKSDNMVDDFHYWPKVGDGQVLLDALEKAMV
jgi:hypothetical protein